MSMGIKEIEFSFWVVIILSLRNRFDSPFLGICALLCIEVLFIITQILNENENEIEPKPYQTTPLMLIIFVKEVFIN